VNYAPRDYQLEAIEAVEQSWKTGNLRAAVVSPTGSGKTVTFSHLIKRQAAWLRSNGLRTLVLAHREELLEQAAEKIRQVCPDLLVGIVKGSRDESSCADVVIASAQTMAGAKRRERIGNIGLVIADECHHYSAKTFKTVLEHYGCLDNRTRTVGFTATMTRMDNSLTTVWPQVTYEISIQRMMREGHLVTPVGRSVTVEGLNLSKVKVTAGDFNNKAVSDAMEASHAWPVVASAYVEHAKGRPAIAFTPDIASADSLHAEFEKLGIRSETVTGSTKSAERDAIYRRFRSGATDVLTSVMVLTEGFDAPHTSCVIVARPTKSPGLYMQMVGRGLRPSPATGKSDCMILDVAGVSELHGGIARSFTALKRCMSDCACDCIECGCDGADCRKCDCPPGDHGADCDHPQRHGCRCGEHCDCPCGCDVEKPSRDARTCSGECACGCEQGDVFCGCSNEEGECGCECLVKREKPEAEEVEIELSEFDFMMGTFAKSRVTWLQTRAGVWFVPAGDNAYVFVLPSLADEGFIFGSVMGSEFQRRDAGSQPVNGAQADAERFRAEWMYGRGVSDYNARSARWRKGPASWKQTDLLKKLGVWEDGMNKGAASDAQSVYFASRVLDRRFGQHMAQAAAAGHPGAAKR
jgi:superfamily II DNA or RNA helicase